MRWDLKTRSLNTELPGGRRRSIIMGILNVTPDSFSDGGQFLAPADALRQARQMASDGADIIDIGGESTRPGAAPVDAETEKQRVVPIVEALASDGMIVSVDTSKPSVARAALDAGAEIVNDVTGLSSEDMLAVIADRVPGVVTMHMQGEPRTMQNNPTYRDVVGEVRDALVASAERAEGCGLARSQICIDPGIGFGKTTAHNWTLLASTDVLAATGYNVLIGHSRKWFLGELLGEEDPGKRDDLTAAVAVAAVLRGASVVRVHNVSLIRRAAAVADAIVGAD